jgi:hypothetical protein
MVSKIASTIQQCRINSADYDIVLLAYHSKALSFYNSMYVNFSLQELFNEKDRLYNFIKKSQNMSPLDEMKILAKLEALNSLIRG